ncbi:undecaprenyldiphospho-muramoylpentapeptide beta-N-acetylglucosaminyltransferase [Campylobacter mucosalis]|uniref:undecaprenyldiphospho-muramoylpentapeptide beta-N-acetylglucosaminyltransferase n=1 Tax=Campylobacter mucosalis TaxID=202 RepID=UPI00147034C4|nr:undecaprenyldiphospho-muramoylpentapeptide beta-N-acetylglucosaminyltransferase [Campylobacter mucosalis]
MIAISGGGTGGHLAIARAFCKQLNLLNKKSIFIGSQNGQDKMWFENDENFSKCYFLPSSGVVNKRGLAKLESLLNIIKLAFKCKEIFKQNKIKAVISVGGYSAAPASIAAILCGIPLFIHEQNAVNGRLNSLLKPFAKGFYSSYTTAPFCYPVDEKFFLLKRQRQELKTILFLGGSQGAKAINELAINIAINLKNMGVKIIHQCGKNSFFELKDRYEKLGLSSDDVKLFDFSQDIELKMHEADLCISRAGASSLWEITANALPAIFIPFPHAASNHQFYNAKFLKDANLAEICLQNGPSVDSDKILKIIKEYDIAKTSKALSGIINLEKTNEIINDIISKGKL